jgi:arginine decarboxylase
MLRPARPTSPNVRLYAAMERLAADMVQHERELLTEALDRAGHVRAESGALEGLHVMHEDLLGEQASHDLDELPIVIDVSALGVSGYTAADWLRAHHALAMGITDHRRIGLQLSYGDDPAAIPRLLTAMRRLSKRRTACRKPHRGQEGTKGGDRQTPLGRRRRARPGSDLTAASQATVTARRPSATAPVAAT